MTLIICPGFSGSLSRFPRRNTGSAGPGRNNSGSRTASQPMPNPSSTGFKMCIRDRDKVKGLGLGADDYITKPFALAELIARVECVLRRYHRGQEKLLFRDLEIDAVSRVVGRNGENLSRIHI